MSIWYLAINTLFSFLSALLIYLFLKFNFGIARPKVRIVLFLGVFGSLNGIVSTLWTQIAKDNNEFQLIKPVLIIILSIQAIKVMLKIDWGKTVLSFFVITIAIGIGNFLIPLIFSLFGFELIYITVSKDPLLYLSVNICIFIVEFLIILLTKLIAKINKIKNLKPVSILLGLTIFVMVINNSVNYLDNFYVNSIAIALISSLVFLVATLIYINKYLKHEKQTEELRQQQFYNISLSSTLQDMRRFKHDQANHLSVLEFMIKNNKNAEAYEYITEIQNDPSYNINTSIFSIGNVALFAIISTKIEKAKRQGVEFTLNTAGTIGSIPHIKVYELCEIIGIYLDNAIEAAELSTKKNINMSVIEYVDSIDIKITNSCDEMPVMGMLKQNGYSTKGENRGNGLAIAEKILKKYKAVFNIMTFDESVMQFNQEIKIKKA